MSEAEDFVVFWQSATSLFSVCRRFKLKPQAACERARKMRQHGVNLKFFKKQMVRREEDWAVLRRLAAAPAAPKEMTPTEKALREEVRDAYADCLRVARAHHAPKTLIAALESTVKLLALPPAVAEEAGKAGWKRLGGIGGNHEDCGLPWAEHHVGSLTCPPAPVADTAPEREPCACGEKREHYHDRNDSRVYAPVSLTEEERDRLGRIGARHDESQEFLDTRKMNGPECHYDREFLLSLVRRLTEKP